MVKPGALLLLLAVAASQVDRTTQTQSNISSCAINFYGSVFSWIDVVFDNSSVAVCFMALSSDPPQDCLVFEDRGDAVSDSIDVVFDSTVVGSDLHASLQDIQTNSTCYIVITLLNSTVDVVMNILVYNFNNQAAVEIITSRNYSPANVTVDAMFGKSNVDSWSFTNSQMISSVFIDVSGCRDRGFPFTVRSQMIHPETCEISVCDSSAGFSSYSTCNDTEVCKDSSCVLPTIVCTVTGSAVIDFNNRLHTIPDRCAYSLVKHVGPFPFLLAGVFRERHRKDVPFLDELILHLQNPDVTIYLKQGGQLWVDNQLLTLNATVQLVHGVEFSKEEGRVIAQVPNFVKVLFDGNTAHISGPLRSLEALCGNAVDPSMTTTVSNETSTYGDSGCEIQHEDTVDNTVNCTRATEYCNRMGQAPFTACHSYIDPGPYINACINTSCTYPNVDGLICQYVEAYAISCHLKKDITLVDWRSATGCAAVLQHSCRDQYCSSHEFCGEKLGETRCLCRALFANMYTPTNSLGDPTVCTQNSATVTLPVCLLWDKGIDYSSLHLNDPSCTGNMDYITNMLTFSFKSNTCGTEVIMMNNSNIIFKNTIMTRNTSMHSAINRHHDVDIEFSCLHRQPTIRTMDFHIADSSVVQQIKSGVWNYTLTLAAYSDPGHLNLLQSDSSVLLNQRIWLELSAGGLDETKVAMVIDACWATDQPSPDVGLRHDLVVGGCPSPEDETVDIGENGLGTSDYFSFSMFEFYGENVNIYLHCQVELCPKDSSCVPDCSGVGLKKRRVARSEYTDGNPALITMAWNK